jgi:hypothetical protein
MPTGRAGFGHIGARGLNALIATVTTGVCARVIVALARWLDGHKRGT